MINCIENKTIDDSKLLVSVVTVCLNSEHTIRDTLTSVAHQSYSDIEQIVIDGVSTDNTLDIVSEFPGSVSCVVSEKDEGIYDAMNKGIEHARGDILFFLNSDDQFYDANVVSDIVDVFRCSPDASLVYGDAVYITSNKDVVSCFEDINKNNIIFSHLCHQAVFAKRELFANLGNFDLQYSINADYDWLLRVFFSGANTRYIKRNITKFNAMGRHMDDVVFLQKERKSVRMKYVGATQYYLGESFYRIKRKIMRIAGLCNG